MGYQITDWCHSIIRPHAVKQGVYIDATMGKGRDTLFLCELAGKEGSVWAFDIQEQALDATRALLDKHGYGKNVHLIKDGHEKIDRYFAPKTADVICFNFGYLPGGDHRIATQAGTSLAAVQKSLKILKSGGMMSLCIYSGGDTGFEEKDCILSYVKELSAKEYTVIVNEYYNRKNCPPLPEFIFKN